MTSVRILWLLLCLFWNGTEIKLGRKNRLDSKSVSDSEERSQRVLWITVVAGLLSALVFKTLAWIPIPMEYLPRQIFALLLFATGLYLRYFTVGRLGRFFTTNVSIQHEHEHELIITGPYRWVRHPAYTGLLIALAAAGLSMGDLIALFVLTAPTFFAFTFRIGIEEKLLNKRFGTAYRDYSKTTRKLFPWLF